MYSILPFRASETFAFFAALSLLELSLLFAALYRRFGRRKEYAYFGALMFFLSGLLYTSLRVLQDERPLAQLFWLRGELVCGVWVFFFMLHFVAEVTGRKWRRLWSPVVLLAVAALLSLAPLCTEKIVRLAPVGTLIDDVFDRTLGTLFIPYCLILVTGGLYACLLLWQSNRRHAHEATTRQKQTGETREESTFTLARFQQRILAALLFFLACAGLQLFDASPINHFEWQLFPYTVAALGFSGVTAWSLWSELLRLQLSRHRLEALAEARLHAASDTQHQIKNGLATVDQLLKNARRGLERGQPAERIERKLRQSQQEIEALDQSLRIMLDRARVEAGQPLTPGKQSAVDIAALARGLCFRQLVQDKEWDDPAEGEKLLAEAVTFDLRLHATHYSVFRWPLEQALTNLIDNTVKYATHPLPITIAIEETDDGRLLFIVRDQGVGIAPEDLERIFTEAFYRSQAHPNQTVGAGIGLNLARCYVEAQGGRLWAQSEGIGKGSAFYLQVPAERGEPGEPEVSGQRPGEAQGI